MPELPPRLVRAGVTLRYIDKPGMFGLKRYAVELVSALQALGLRVRRQRVLVREASVAGRRVGGLVTKAVSSWWPRLPRLLVHATSHRCNPVRRPAPVVTVHDLIPTLHPDLTAVGEKGRAADERALRRAVATARCILTDSAVVKGELVRHLGADPACVRPVHLGLRHDVFHPDSGAGARHPAYRPGRLNVLVAMNLDLRKRADLVLEAAAGLPFVHVVQVGSTAVTPALMDRFRPLRGSAARLRAQGRLIHLDGADDDGLRRLYGGADLVIHPSAAEGFSLPPLEALACGAPVLASDIPVHREILGEHARYAPLDAEALRREMERAWDGQAVRPGLYPPREARLAHARRFTWDATARGTLGAYVEALEAPA